ncbi:MAG: UDP-N-acetylmuramoyl-L-alanine--D-glutamate ligase [bacterium]
MSHDESIAVLGEGVTARSIHAYLNRHGVSCVPIDQAETLIVSPGIPPRNFPKTNAAIVPEIEWSYLKLQQKKQPPFVIAVTGTNGKSTVSTLLGHFLDAPVFGNIGIPLTEAIDCDPCPTTIIVEVSSFQLECCRYFRADIVILLNISEDHIDRHTSFENYIQAKSKLVDALLEKDLLIYNQNDPIVCQLSNRCVAKKRAFSTDLLRDYHYELPIVKDSLAAAISGVEYLSISPTIIQEKLNSFRPLAHRIEKVACIKDRLFFNDSKSTTPSSTLAALKTFPKKVHLILCGNHKNIDFSSYKEALLKHSLSISVFGDLSPCIAALFHSSSIPIYIHDTMLDAVSLLFPKTKANDIILFSPAGASFDQFQNFKERGEHFKSIVHQLCS